MSHNIYTAVFNFTLSNVVQNKIRILPVRQIGACKLQIGKRVFVDAIQKADREQDKG